MPTYVVGPYGYRADGDVGFYTGTTSSPATDGSYGDILAGYATRPQNRLFIIWKRTA